MALVTWSVPLKSMKTFFFVFSMYHEIKVMDSNIMHTLTEEL